MKIPPAITRPLNAAQQAFARGLWILWKDHTSVQVHLPRRGSGKTEVFAEIRIFGWLVAREAIAKAAPDGPSAQRVHRGD